MKKFALVLTAVALALTGCNNAKTLNQTATSAVVLPDYQPFSKVFSCDNGMTPSLYYPNDNQVELTLQGATTTLNAATRGSGSRYVSNTGIFGHGGEWHEKGDMAIFSYPGVHGTAEVSCTAQ
jgi:hypothetical protein